MESTSESILIQQGILKPEGWTILELKPLPDSNDIPPLDFSEWIKEVEELRTLLAKMYG